MTARAIVNPVLTCNNVVGAELSVRPSTAPLIAGGLPRNASRIMSHLTSSPSLNALG